MSNSQPDPRGLSRRSLARVISGAAAAALLPGRSEAVEAPAHLSKQFEDSHTEALVEAALSATPATLSAEQRLGVRRGVRDLQKALADARMVKLDYDVDPAVVFLADLRK